MKYKVGDKVRVRKKLESGNEYDGVVASKGMIQYRGKITTISRILPDRTYFLEEGEKYYWTDEMLEDVESGVMMIKVYVDGNKVIAKKDGKVGIARCSPDDKFDIFIGAKLALERLEEQCKPYAWLRYSEPYYIPSVSEEGLCRTRYYNNDAIDDRMKERGLVFKTEEEAIEAAKKMLAVLKEGDSND